MQFYSPSWQGQVDSKKTSEFSSIQAIVQLRLLSKQQANKQWVKTLTTFKTSLLVGYFTF